MAYKQETLPRILGGIQREPLGILAAGVKSASVITNDFNGDEYLNLVVANEFSDNVSILINQMVAAPSPDLNGDGVVNTADLTTLLAQWGTLELACNALEDGSGLLPES